MYSYTRGHVPSISHSQPGPIISPPVMPATALDGFRFYEYHHHQHSSYEPQPSPHLERRPSQVYVRPSAVPGPYSPTAPSAEFAALYLRDDAPIHNSHGARSHSRGHAHTHTSSRIREPSGGHSHAHAHAHTHAKGQAAHIPTTSRTQTRPTAHREHRHRRDDRERERERGRTLHRNERRPSVSEASHVATLGGTSTREHTASHSTRPSPAHTSRHHRHPPQPKAPTARPTVPAHKHASSQNQVPASQSHARDHRSHVHAHTNQPPNSHGHTYPPVHQQHQHHEAPQLGVAYVPTAPPSDPHLSRSPRDYSHVGDDERRARSQSAPRHRILRPGRSAMRDRYSSRSRSRSHVRFGQEKRPQKPIAIPVGGRSRSRKPGVDFGWLRVPR